MAARRVLYRLLQVRQLEEQHLKTELEAQLAELRRLVEAQSSAVERERHGRVLVQESILTGALHDRLAGLEEVRSAKRLYNALSPMIETARREVGELRAQYTTKRIQRRQAETLIEAAKAEHELEASRRDQKALDEGHRSLRQRSEEALRLAAKTQALGRRLFQAGSCKPEET
jgi:flagellar biosynthesis chaperone FliJ